MPGHPSFQDVSTDEEAAHAADVASGPHLLGFSDEILLHILSHVPSTDLILNVRRTCRKLATLCLDKSLVHTVLLQKDYQVRQPGCQGGTGPARGHQEVTEARAERASGGHTFAVWASLPLSPSSCPDRNPWHLCSASCPCVSPVLERERKGRLQGMPRSV